MSFMFLSKVLSSKHQLYFQRCLLFSRAMHKFGFAFFFPLLLVAMLLQGSAGERRRKQQGAAQAACLEIELLVVKEHHSNHDCCSKFLPLPGLPPARVGAGVVSAVCCWCFGGTSGEQGEILPATETAEIKTCCLWFLTQLKFGFRQLSRKVQLYLCFSCGKEALGLSGLSGMPSGQGEPEWVQDLPQCPPAQPHVGRGRAPALPAHHSNF